MLSFQLLHKLGYREIFNCGTLSGIINDFSPNTLLTNKQKKLRGL
jgi:hypothetical protein